VIDTRAYVETSSYGSRAIDSVVRVLGVDMVVNGSDRPYARPGDPGLGEAARHSISVTSPAQLLGHDRLLPAGAPAPSVRQQERSEWIDHRVAASPMP
jgi:6-methylsalicylate decarboxylase